MSRSLFLLVSRRLPMRGIVAVAFSAAACYDGTGPPSSTAVRLEAMTATSVTGTVGAEIGPVPEFGQGVETTNMKGIATVKGHVKVLVDLDCVLGTDGPALGSWSEAAR